MDTLLHALGAFVLFGAPFFWWPLAFLSGLAVGAMRELAQHTPRLGLLDDRAWKDTYWDYTKGKVRMHRVWETVGWGLGAFLAALLWRVL